MNQVIKHRIDRRKETYSMIPSKLIMDARLSSGAKELIIRILNDKDDFPIDFGK